jgi:arsenate reductase
MTLPATVIFACPKNVARSRMAAAWFNQLVDPMQAHAIAAGVRDHESVDVNVCEAMDEAGVDLAAAESHVLTTNLALEAELLVTLGCGEVVPMAPGGARAYWALSYPGDATFEECCRIRDEIRVRVKRLLWEKRWLP